MVVSTRKWEKINAENNASIDRFLIAVCENNAENAQQKADGCDREDEIFSSPNF